MNNNNYKIIDYKIGDIVIFDYFERQNKKSVDKCGEIVYISNIDNTVNIKDFFSNTIINIDKKILKLKNNPYNCNKDISS